MRSSTATCIVRSSSVLLATTHLFAFLVEQNNKENTSLKTKSKNETHLYQPSGAGWLNIKHRRKMKTRLILFYYLQPLFFRTLPQKKTQEARRRVWLACSAWFRHYRSPHPPRLNLPSVFAVIFLLPNPPTKKICISRDKAVEAAGNNDHSFTPRSTTICSLLTIFSRRTDLLL